MPKTVRVQHIYLHKSGLPRDQVVNTFYFHSPVATGLSIPDMDTLRDAVIGLYDDSHTGQTIAVHSFIPETSMAPNRHRIKIYDMADPEPRVPVRDETPQVADVNNSVQGMPAEVALCLSYRGAIESGTNAAKRRGRVFIGPLSPSVGATDAAGHWRPVAAVRESLTFAANGMKDAVEAEGWQWVVHGGTFGDFPIFTPITHVWVDDAFDTQRRRGPSPTLRTALDI